MKKVEMLYLSQEDIMSLKIGWADVIRLTEAACSEQANGTIECPPKRGVHTRPDCFIHEMPVWLKGMDACGIKWVSGYPYNYKYDLPQILGVQVMNCPETGVPLAVMDCRWLTAARTAAATAITAKFCAKKGSSVMTIIGAGVQGRMNLLATQEVLKTLKTCKIFEIREEVSSRFKALMEEHAGVEVVVCKSIAEAMEGSDIVMTCTQKLPHPIIPAESFKPGMMGGGLEAGRAWPGALLHGVDKVITDHLEQTLSYNAPGVFEGGMPTFHATLGELVNGTKKGRENDEERILAFNIGFAAEDIALGQLIYEKAKERGIGIMLPLMEVEDIY